MQLQTFDACFQIVQAVFTRSAAATTAAGICFGQRLVQRLTVDVLVDRAARRTDVRTVIARRAAFLGGILWRAALAATFFPSMLEDGGVIGVGRRIQCDCRAASKQNKNSN